MERGNYTLLALVEDESAVERCIAALEAVVGDLPEPHTGVLAAWPVPIVRGVSKARDRQ